MTNAVKYQEDASGYFFSINGRMALGKTFGLGALQDVIAEAKRFALYDDYKGSVIEVFAFFFRDEPDAEYIDMSDYKKKLMFTV
jgi:hypothetical protein